MNHFLLAALVLALANAYPDGAPLEACETLEPNHEGVVGQGNTESYGFTAVNNGDGSYQVSIEITDAAASGFKGFIVQARQRGATTPVGYFNDLPADAHGLGCSNGHSNTVTHSVNSTKTTASFRWNPEGTQISGVTFNGAVVQVRTIYWAGLQSVDLGTLP